MKILKNIVVLFVIGFAFCSSAIAAEGAHASQADGTWVWWISPIGSLLALGFAYYFYKKMMGAPEGTDKMIEIARHVREGAYAYLFRQYSVVTIVFIVLLAIFGVIVAEMINTSVEELINILSPGHRIEAALAKNVAAAAVLLAAAGAIVIGCIVFLPRII